MKAATSASDDVNADAETAKDGFSAPGGGNSRSKVGVGFALAGANVKPSYAGKEGSTGASSAGSSPSGTGSAALNKNL